MHREAVLKILGERVSAAQDRNNEPAARFNKVTADYPNAIPHPDGVTRVRDAAQRYRRAMKELTAAHQQMAEFLLNGVIPEDLENPRPH